MKSPCGCVRTEVVFAQAGTAASDTAAYSWESAEKLSRSDTQEFPSLRIPAALC